METVAWGVFLLWLVAAAAASWVALLLPWVRQRYEGRHRDVAPIQHPAARPHRPAARAA